MLASLDVPSRVEPGIRPRSALLFPCLLEPPPPRPADGSNVEILRTFFQPLGLIPRTDIRPLTLPVSRYTAKRGRARFRGRKPGGLKVIPYIPRRDRAEGDSASPVRFS